MAIPELNEKHNQNSVTSQRLVHIRIQQRNGRKSLTTVQGLDPRLDCKKLTRAMQKKFNCNGTVTVDPELGTVLQLQGDQRFKTKKFLISENLLQENELIIHGA